MFLKIGILNKTKTISGKRKLKEWFMNPLTDINAIKERQLLIKTLIERKLIPKLQTVLKGLGDLKVK